jgi:hypothetical protein
MIMTSREAFEKKTNELKGLAEEIESDASRLFEGTPLEYKNNNISILSRYYWGTPPDALKQIRRDVERKYQIWYSTAHQLIKKNIPDRLEEFISYYEKGGFYSHYDGISQWLRLENTFDYSEKVKIKDQFIKDFDKQINILLSIPSVIDAKELDLRKVIAADLIDSELDQAELLFRNGLERAAGTIAGVALERYLKTQCDINGVAYEYKDTIEPLAQALYSAEKIENTELKKIIYLGGIRNDCAHPKDVEKEQVRSLIEQVKKIVG